MTWRLYLWWSGDDGHGNDVDDCDENDDEKLLKVWTQESFQKYVEFHPDDQTQPTFTMMMIVMSLGDEEGDVRELKQRRRRHQRERQKNNSLRLGK